MDKQKPKVECNDDYDAHQGLWNNFIEHVSADQEEYNMMVERLSMFIYVVCYMLYDWFQFKFVATLGVQKRGSLMIINCMHLHWF